MNKAIKTEKKFEFFLGLFFLIPPILAVFFFIFNLFDWADGYIVEMRYLGGEWEARYGDGGGATPPAPIYLGLMAIAGVLLVKNSLRYLVNKDEDAAPTTNETKEVKATEPQQAPKAENVVVEDSNINEALGL